MGASLLLGIGLTLIAGPRAGRSAPQAGQDLTRFPEDGAVSQRFLVTLTGLPLARYDGSLPGLPRPPRDARGKLALHSAQAQAYLDALRKRQQAFRKALGAALPNAEVHHVYRVVYHGLVVKARRGDLARLRSLPGVQTVQTTDRVAAKPLLDVSVPLIGAPGFWATVGGAAAAGSGVKVAVLDTGIDDTHPFFDPAGYTYPAGYPLGETDYTSPKIIVARVYFRADDPVDPEEDWPSPMDANGHGSQMAGIIAAVPDTVVDVGPQFQPTITGVAPAAYLMNYKVFYSAVSGQTTALEPELIAAVEDAVTDGADIINNSWGQIDVFGNGTPVIQALDAAVEAGCVVVTAAGNAGPCCGTIESPGAFPRFITVGATSTGRTFGLHLEVTAPAPVPASLQRMLARQAFCSPHLTADVGPVPVVFAGQVGAGTNADGCQPFAPGALDGVLAVVEAPVQCSFWDTLANVQDGGAVGMVVWDGVPGEEPIAIPCESAAVPVVMISYEDGDNLVPWLETTGDATAVLRMGLEPFAQPAGADRLVQFSGRGPTAWGHLKPDLVAPGENILSAGVAAPDDTDPALWGVVSGTSPAAAHVAGAAALLKNRYPDWTHDQIKAALVGTAWRQSLLDYDGASVTPQGVGGGRLDATALTDIRLLAQPAVLNVGELEPSASVTQHLQLTRVASDLSEVTVTWDSPPAGLSVSVDGGATVSFDAAGAAEASLTFTLSASASPGELEGYLYLEDDEGGTTVVPYYLRSMADPDQVDLLLVDLTFADEVGSPDYLPIYEDAADAAGLTWERTDASRSVAAPTLPELARYRAVLLATGDAPYGWGWFGDNGVCTLGRLSSYMRRGGGVIVAGQGPLRASVHRLFTVLTGTMTDMDEPLRDEGTDQLVVLDEYAVAQMDDPQLITANLMLDPQFSSLVMLGELYPAKLPTMDVAWSHRVLRLTEEAVAVGVVYDPYLFYGVDPLAELQTHRAVYLGFGLEAVKDPSPSSGIEPGSRAELLYNAFRWVSERVQLQVEVDPQGWQVTLQATATATHSDIDRYTFDFGDGSDPVQTPQPTATHTYDQDGDYPLEVRATSQLGAVAIHRQTITVPSDALDGGVDAADASGVTPPGNGKGCHCASTPPAGSIGFWGILLLLGLVWRRRTSRTRRARD